MKKNIYLGLLGVWLMSPPKTEQASSPEVSPKLSPATEANLQSEQGESSDDETDSPETENLTIPELKKIIRRQRKNLKRLSQKEKIDRLLQTNEIDRLTQENIKLCLEVNRLQTLYNEQKKESIYKTFESMEKDRDTLRRFEKETKEMRAINARLQESFDSRRRGE